MANMDEMTVALAQRGQTGSVASIRDHTIVMDRPSPHGGSDAGPMGGETLLASVGGCFMSTLYAAAQARSIPIEGASCRVTGVFAPNPRRFGAIRIEVTCDSCPSADLEHLVEVADRGCLVAATLRQGIEVTASVAASHSSADDSASSSTKPAARPEQTIARLN
ncbi:OsmC family protein [Micromonospora sp. KC213]|uniref:OsmC family protein n=1 Tax=Micromonospora sp. KC213 TaxID=2530378 RepID=UPI001046E86B|nr:OsmC family protein [Micromonospora sp. KC213]TDC39141.1 OsmC family peroxiredoxin [Micromonospora sp. KC213]